MRTLSQVLDAIHNIEPERQVIEEDQFFENEFTFQDEYGLDVYAHTLIIALMRRDEHTSRAYEDFLEYASRGAEADRLRELEHFSTTENGDFDYMDNF